MTRAILGFVLVLAAGVARADQPYVRRALDLLERAEQALEAAGKTKGGQRERALEQVRKAEYELQQALQRDD
jgi:F0F1-type ATP synthase epsilon subunit